MRPRQIGKKEEKKKEGANNDSPYEDPHDFVCTSFAPRIKIPTVDNQQQQSEFKYL